MGTDCRPPDADTRPALRDYRKRNARDTFTNCNAETVGRCLAALGVR